ncbi:MAG: TRAP transporter small permease [Pseudomonadota bacterium]
MVRLVDGGARALFALAAAALALIVAITVYEVTSRYLLGAPTVWVSDITGVLLAWSIALAAPEVTRRRGHVAIAILTTMGPWRTSRARLPEWVSAIVCAGAAWIVASEGWRQVERGITTQGATQVPKAWITAALALGLLWTAIVFASLALRPPADD